MPEAKSKGMTGMQRLVLFTSEHVSKSGIKRSLYSSGFVNISEPKAFIHGNAC